MGMQEWHEQAKLGGHVADIWEMAEYVGKCYLLYPLIGFIF